MDQGTFTLVKRRYIRVYLPYSCVDYREMLTSVRCRSAGMHLPWSDVDASGCRVMSLRM